MVNVHGRHALEYNRVDHRDLSPETRMQLSVSTVHKRHVAIERYRQDIMGDAGIVGLIANRHVWVVIRSWFTLRDWGLAGSAVLCVVTGIFTAATTTRSTSCAGVDAALGVQIVVSVASAAFLLMEQQDLDVSRQKVHRTSTPKEAVHPQRA